MELKSFFTANDTIIEEAAYKMVKIIYELYIWQLVTRVYKELRKLNTTKTNKPILKKNGAGMKQS